MLNWKFSFVFFLSFLQFLSLFCLFFFLLSSFLFFLSLFLFILSHSISLWLSFSRSFSFFCPYPIFARCLLYLFSFGDFIYFQSTTFLAEVRSRYLRSLLLHKHKWRTPVYLDNQHSENSHIVLSWTPAFKVEEKSLMIPATAHLQKLVLKNKKDK